MKLGFVLLGLSAVLVISAMAQRQEPLTIDQVMTPDELKSTGVSTLSQAQRKELDRWLTRYTYLVFSREEKEQRM